VEDVYISMASLPDMDYVYIPKALELKNIDKQGSTWNNANIKSVYTNWLSQSQAYHDDHLTPKCPF